MTPEQAAALGEVEVKQIDKTISSAYELKDEIDAADIIAVVAPIHIQEQFLKIAGDKPVITALSERIIEKSEDNSESKVVFKFAKWERLVEIKVVKEDFKL